MRILAWAIFIGRLYECFVITSDVHAGDLKPYPLPPKARAGIEELAASSDVLILGEIHGTQEVPELVAGLLARLTELDYHTLAIEVPNDAQAQLLAWARGEIAQVPDFFAKPNGDGKGNVQLLELVRTALLPPFRWQVVCFDDSEAISEKREHDLMQKKRAEGADAPQLTAEDEDTLWRERDAAMAVNLLREATSLKATGKMLAICGNIHARLGNDQRVPMLAQLWPSFAAKLKEGRPAWRVSSVNVEFHGGSFFNEDKVQAFHERHLEQPVVRPATMTGWWNLDLCLPRATPATFLSPGTAR